MTPAIFDRCSDCIKFNRGCKKRIYLTEPLDKCPDYLSIASLPKVSYETLHKIFKKWFFISRTTRNMIDLELADYLENEIEGTPLWVIIKGASGDLKSEVTNALVHCPRIIELNDVTGSTFVSGSKNVVDVGKQLQKRHRIIVIRDLAAMLSLHKDTKKEVIGRLRTLYDGFLLKHYGTIGEKKYKNITVNLLANATNAIEDENMMGQVLGTRELFYDTAADKKDNFKKMKKAIENEENEIEMRKQLSDAVLGFLAHHRIDSSMPIPDEIEQFIKGEAHILSILRASGKTDPYTWEVVRIPIPEVPTRLAKQFRRLYKALKSLDETYPDSRAQEIIQHIVLSSGNPNRAKVLEAMAEKADMYDIKTVADKVRLGFKTTKKELEVLWSMGVLERSLIKEDKKNRYQYWMSKDFEWFPKK